MNRIYNYLIFTALAFATVSCLEKEILPNDNEVKFGMSLEKPDTKTIYGPESNNAFPIYWSQGDKVLVASPQCAITSAEYLVTPVSGQSYAEALNKTGASGVQWGSTDADFYSVYPSTNASWMSLKENEVIAKLKIASQQEANIVLDGKTYTYSAADMKNVVMYAQTDNAKRGTTVDLKYKPYSTMIEFELGIGENVDEQNKPNGTYGSVKIFSLTLTAPDGVALTGDFTLRFNGDDDPTIVAAGNNGNSIKMNFTTQPLLNETNKTLKAKVAMIPFSNIKLHDWTVSVEVLEGTATATKTYTMKLNVDKPETEEVEQLELAAGKVHKVKLPKFSSKTAWDPDMSEWITTLYDYKNIYITELSLPGAWYAGAPTSDNYQSTDNFATLWNAGVRAFAVECRTATSSWTNNTPSRVVISGTGSNSIGLTGGGSYYYGGDRISTVIQSIANQVANSLKKDSNGTVIDGEFAVLVLSYADGGKGGHRAADYNYFINGIKTEIANAGVSNIYSDPVTALTTVSDVLGKLIIKINVDKNLPKNSYAGDMNALLSYNPFIQQLTDVDYTKPLFSKLYWKTWDDSYKVTTETSDDFLWCFASANRTQLNTGTNTTIPTYAQRQTALRAMIEHSKELTASKKHNVWFYFNAGGTQTTSMTDETTSATNFASTMNTWLYDLIKLKANGGTDINGVYGTTGAYIESEPSPLGIVMFNQCTNSTYKGPQIIEEIVFMNNKIKLLRSTDTDDSDDKEEGEGGTVRTL